MQNLIAQKKQNWKHNGWLTLSIGQAWKNVQDSLTTHSILHAVL